MIKDYVDLLLISETKIDSSFPIAQFHIDGYTIHRCDSDENGGGLLLYVREGVPSALLKTDSEIEAFYVELTIRKKKWLLCCSYNPNKNFIMKHCKYNIFNTFRTNGPVMFCVFCILANYEDTSGINCNIN